MKSCIFEGRVRHTRHAPVPHRFEYRHGLAVDENGYPIQRGATIAGRRSVRYRTISNDAEPEPMIGTSGHHDKTGCMDRDLGRDRLHRDLLAVVTTTS